MQIVKLVGMVGLRGKAARGQMIRVDEREAIRIALSLLNQIYTSDANADRAEFIANDDGLNGKPSYFSISVHPSGMLEAYKQRVKELEDFVRDYLASSRPGSKLAKMSSRKLKRGFSK